MPIMGNKMTRIAIRIEHKNLPLTASNIFADQMTREEITCAVARFEHVLFTLAGDDTLTVSKSVPATDQETIYFISSSLERTALISEVERSLSSLKLGGNVVESVDETDVAASADRFTNQKSD
jgi:uncharacterized protein YaaN involved in tellurite resistance